MSSRHKGRSFEASWWRLDLSRSQLRLLSLIAVAGIVGGFLVPLIAPDLLPRWLASALRTVGYIMALRFAAQGPVAFPGQPGELDERELAERARALAISYWVMMFGFGAVMMWLVTSFLWEPWSPNAVEAMLLGWGVFWLLVLLPGMLLVWRPSPSDGDD